MKENQSILIFDQLKVVLFKVEKFKNPIKMIVLANFLTELVL